SQNDKWLDQYRTRQQNLLERAEKEGEKLSPLLDAEMNKFQVSAKQCVKKMKEDRMVYTSKMDAFKSEFTALENELEKDLYTAIQKKRDVSAAIYVKEQREKEQEEAKKLA